MASMCGVRRRQRQPADPHNSNFVYQRFQSGILVYDGLSDTPAALPLGEYLEDVLTGQNLPSDLAALSGTDLSDAFPPDVE